VVANTAFIVTNARAQKRTGTMPAKEDDASRRIPWSRMLGDVFNKTTSTYHLETTANSNPPKPNASPIQYRV
jgi:hypothetical protein